LFSASRRPPIVAGPIVAPPPQKQGDPAPPPPEQASFTLVGTIVSPKASVAVFKDPTLTRSLDFELGKKITVGGCEGSICAQSSWRKAHNL
jgi:hypothetical protein